MQKMICRRCHEQNIVVSNSLYAFLNNLEECHDFICGECELAELEAHRITEICKAGKIMSELSNRELNNFMLEIYNAYGINKLIDIAHSSKKVLEDINE